MIIKSKAEARSLIAEHLASLQVSPPTDLEIIDEYTMETEFGWIFFWNSKLFLETGDAIYALAGNSPFIVDCEDGSIHPTSSAKPIDEIIDDYRRRRSL